MPFVKLSDEQPALLVAAERAEADAQAKLIAAARRWRRESRHKADGDCDCPGCSLVSAVDE